MTSERFFINTSIRGVDRYNMAKFMFYDVDNYDPLTSTLFQELKSLPSVAFFEVTNESRRLDIISYKIYQVSGLWWLIALYNDITNVDEVENGTVLAYPSRQAVEVFIDGLQARKASQ